MLAVRAAASAIVITTAADKDDDEQDNPGAVTVTKEVISTHERFLLFSDFIIYYENYLKLVTSLNKIGNIEKTKEKQRKRENINYKFNKFNFIAVYSQI